MPNKTSPYVPGELSLKVLIVTLFVFLALDTALYFFVSAVFPRGNSQPTLEVSVDQRIGDLDRRVASVEQRLNALDANLNARPGEPEEAWQSTNMVQKDIVSRQELERLKRDVRKLNQELCNSRKPCKPCKP